LDGRGVLFRGPSASGKSDIAVRLIDAGALLVADDRVMLTVAAGRCLAAPPPAIAGRIEVRGLGIVSLPWRAPVALALIVDLVPAEAVERLPEPEVREIGGVRLPRLALDPFAASATAKVRLAVRHLAVERAA